MKKNKNSSTISAFEILKFLRPYIPLLVVSLVLITAQIVATLFVPVIVGGAIDHMVGIGKVDFAYLALSFIYIAICIFVVMICQFCATLCTNKAAFGAVRDIRNASFNKINKVPLSYIDTTPHGEIMSRIAQDTDMISDGLIQGFTQIYGGLVTIIATIIFMLTLNLTITLVVVLITPLSIAVVFLIGKLTHKMFKLQATERGNMTALTEEMIGGGRVIKAFNYQAEAEKKFDVINLRLKLCGIKAMFYSSTSNPSARFVNGIMYAAVCVIGAFLAVSSPATFSVGALSCFLAYANQYTKPFNEITGVVTELQSATAAARRVLELLYEKEEPDDSGLKPLTYIDGSVEANAVYFSYNKTTPLIQNFNLNVLPGQRVAIVGPTGCGKTTLINLLMRFYDVDSGEICVSNQNIKNVTRQSLRRSYGMVLQDSWLFNGTVRQNIAYGKADASYQEIVDAAKQAHIHSFIMRLPSGYDTILNEDSISQGQKQLLTLARIMLTKPPMLILDEATSSIDTRTELKIQCAFSSMMRGRTSFIIAHRLSTIKDADLILVMREGNVIESGTHEQLLSSGGFYSELYYSQFAPTN